MFERQWTCDAALRTFASQQYLTRIERELFAGKSFCHYNGYFEEDVPEPAAYQAEKDTLRFGYAGTLYPHQPLEELAAAMNRAAKRQPDLKLVITFYGAAFYPEQEQRIDRAFRGNAVSWKVTPRYDHQRVMRELAREDVLVLLSNPDIPQLYAKVFDYIALNKVVLHYQGDTGDLQQILNDAGCARQAGDEQELAAVLQSLIEDKCKDRIRIDSINSKKYSRREQVRLLAHALEQHLPTRT
jgi:glycosyltransferase involved in cell wall biosynthesis